MPADIQNQLDQLLAAWHKWAQGYRYGSDINSSPIFRNSKSIRGYDTVQDIVEHEIEHSVMELVDFYVNEMEPNFRTALQINARNLVTGRSVWTSPRLPNDIESRAQLLGLARMALVGKLVAAGVIEIIV